MTNKAKIGPAAIEGAKQLRLIAVTTTGTDNVDSAAAKKAGVAVTNVHDYCSDAVAQHVFALILGMTQKVGQYMALVRSGTCRSNAWSRSPMF